MGMDRRVVVSEFGQGRGVSFGPFPRNVIPLQGGHSGPAVVWSAQLTEFGFVWGIDMGPWKASSVQ